MFLRKFKYPNDFPECSGTRRIVAKRLGSLHSIMFTRYGVQYTYVRLYTLTKVEYNDLTTTYGRLINHTRRASEYLIVPDRRAVTVHVATYKDVIRIGVQYPGNRCDLQTTSKQYAKQLQRSACSKLDWQTVYDDNNNRWSYTQFELLAKDI